jgi:biopolymer transport protein ExbD
MFLLLFFLISNSTLLLVEGVSVRLPEGSGQRPTVFTDSVIVAMDEQHRLYYLNQQVKLSKLRTELSRLAAGAGDEGLLLVLKADRAVNNEAIIKVVAAAQQAGVRQTWLATRPRLFERIPLKQ